MLANEEESIYDLDTYPLYPYLVYQDPGARLATVDAGEIRSFLAQWRDTPLAERLRSVWLKQLATRNLWREYLVDYSPNGSVERRCDYLTALLRTGRADEALTQVEAIWLHPRSRPKECDPVLTAWRKAGHLTQTLVQARMRLAIDAGETELARYLKRFLDPVDHADIDLWIATRRDPDKVARAQRYPVERPIAHRALVAGLRYLAQRDPQKAGPDLDSKSDHVVIGGAGRLPPSSAKSVFRSRIAMSPTLSTGWRGSTTRTTRGFRNGGFSAHFDMAIGGELCGGSTRWAMSQSTLHAGGIGRPVVSRRSVRNRGRPMASRCWQRKEATTAFSPPIGSGVLINSIIRP